jgi:predicted nucleic acid-binding protein
VIVLDASVWVSVLAAGLEVPDLDRTDLYVPPHFDAEVIGALRALRRRRLISDAQATVAVDRHLRAAFWRAHDPSDIRQAWIWRDALSFRDGWYVALAHRLDASWVTADQRAGKTAARLGTPVQLV